MTNTIFYPNERIALFIDGPSIFAAAKGLGFDIDYKRLLEMFAKKGFLVRAYYYTLLSDAEEFTPVKPLVDWLAYNGWSVVTKPGKQWTDSLGRIRVKGNMDSDIIVDVMETAPGLDHIVLGSGDGDLRPLVEAMQRRSKRVSVLSTIKTEPPLCADELRRQADNFIDLDGLRNAIERAVPNVDNLKVIARERTNG